MSSSADSNKPQAWNPDTVYPAPPTYKQVAVTPLLSTSKLVTLAGQTGISALDGSISGNFVDQAREAYRNVYACLRAAGATPRDIVHVRHYIVQSTGDAELDAKDVADRGWGDLWCAFMDQEADGHRPPDTVLGVAGLAKQGVFYEVECWAIVHG